MSDYERWRLRAIRFLLAQEMPAAYMSIWYNCYWGVKHGYKHGLFKEQVQPAIDVMMGGMRETHPGWIRRER